MKRMTVFLAAFLLMLACLAGCSTDMNRNSVAASPQAAPETARVTVSESADFTYALDDYAWDEDAPAEAEENPLTGGGDLIVNPVPESESMAGVERKIITNYDLNMQTREFDGTVEELAALVEQFEGMVQSSWVEGRSLYNEYGARSASFTVRIPAEQAQAFVDQLREQYHVTNTQQYTNDISASYYDVQARLQSMRIREERLVEMLEQAQELEYLLQVDRELSYVRYEIESLTLSLQRMDNSVSLSTINLYVEEVIEYDRLPDEPTSFGSRISYTVSNSLASFAASCQNLLLGFLMILPWIIILAVIAIIVLLIIRSRRQKKKKEQTVAPPPIPVQFSEISKNAEHPENDEDPDPQQ